MKVVLLLAALGCAVAQQCTSGSGEVRMKIMRGTGGSRRTCADLNPAGLQELDVEGCDCPAHKPYWQTIDDASGAQLVVCSDAWMCDHNFVPCSHVTCSIKQHTCSKFNKDAQTWSPKPGALTHSFESDECDGTNHYSVVVNHHNSETNGGAHFCHTSGEGRTEECQCFCLASATR